MFKFPHRFHIIYFTRRRLQFGQSKACSFFSYFSQRSFSNFNNKVIVQKLFVDKDLDLLYHLVVLGYSEMNRQTIVYEQKMKQKSKFKDIKGDFRSKSERKDKILR